MPRSRLYLLLCLILCCFSSGLLAVEKHLPQAYFFNETFGDFKEELDNAKQQHKKAILIMFEMDECPFCQYMKKNVLNRSDIQAYFRENFLIFSVDIEGDLDIVDFMGKTTTQKSFSEKQYRVRATPVFAFFDLNGKMIKRSRFTGKTSNAAEFLSLGHYVVEQAYKKMSFTRYKKQRKINK